MSKLTEEQEKHLISLIDPFEYYEFKYGLENDNLDEYIESLGYTNDFECIDEWGGMGKGTEIGVVQYSESMDLYLRIDGNYYSHSGSEYEEPPYVVRPKEITKIIYV